MVSNIKMSVPENLIFGVFFVLFGVFFLIFDQFFVFIELLHQRRGSLATQQFLPDDAFYLEGEIGMFTQVIFGIFASLSEVFISVVVV